MSTCASFFKQTRRESSWSCLKYPIKTNGLPWDTSFPILSLSIPHIRLPIFAIDNKSKSRFSNLTVFFLIIQRMKNPFATCFYLYINYNPTNVIKTLFRCSTITLFLLFYHDPFPLSQWSIETNFRKRAQTTFFIANICITQCKIQQLNSIVCKGYPTKYRTWWYLENIASKHQQHNLFVLAPRRASNVVILSEAHIRGRRF